MSVLKTIPEELIAAASQLEGLATSLTAQTTGAAAPTTAVAPAAADSVSTLQSAVYSSYGSWYQSIAAEAQAVQQQIVSTLGINSSSYTASEAANALAAQDPFSGIENAFNQIATFLGGPGNSLGGNPFGTSSNGANFISFESGNWASAMSDCLGMAGGGLIPSDDLANLAGTAGDSAAVAGAADVGQVSPMGMGGGMGMGMGAMPMGGIGQATMVSSTAMPPSWAGNVTTVGATSAASPITTGWTGAAPQAGAPLAAMPGMPGAGAGRGSALGAPRYGVKPIVMPKLKAV
jgi:PE family/PPE-SVP subfamily C-terminal region